MNNKQAQRASNILQDILDSAYENGNITEADYNLCDEFISTTTKEGETRDNIETPMPGV